MRVNIAVTICAPGKEVASAILTLEGEQVQSVQLGQWLEQTLSRLCEEVAQQLAERKETRCES